MLVTTVLVVAVKLALVEPAVTVTLAGTPATGGLLLDRVTRTPPEGAAPDNVTVPCDEVPPITVVGLRVNDDNVTGGGGLTVSVALRLTPP